MPEYIDVYTCEDLDGFGLKIQVAIGRELGQPDDFAIRTAGEKIVKALKAETLRLDPDVQAARAKERENMLAVFPDKALIYVHETANQYCHDWCCTQKPWFYVTTPKGLITIGWRKRVISISWEGSDIKQDAEALFQQEDTTKQGRMIHAWGYDKAKEYIGVLLGDAT